MNEYAFKREPQMVPIVETKHRKIQTQIPCPGTVDILDQLEKYEPKSMQGQLPLVWDKAIDFYVYDKLGNKWIDFTSTMVVANIGHSNKHLIKSLSQLLTKNLLHSYSYGTEIRAEYVKKLVEFSPDIFEKAFLLSSGTEATECALKLMRLNGQKHRKKSLGVVCFEGNYHGRTLGAQIMSGDKNQKKWIGYHDPNIYHLPFPYPWVLKDKSGEEFFNDGLKKLEENGVNLDLDLCGFLLETFQGWGAIFYPKDYVEAVREFASKRNILISFDEIQSGFGRTGKNYGYEHYDIDPDILCLGKAMGGGLPLSAVLGSSEVLDLPAIGEMSSTHSANPLSCAAGLATIEEIESNNLVSESKRKGAILNSRLSEMGQKYSDRIAYVLGKGLVAAMIFKMADSGEPDIITPSIISEKAMQCGLLVIHTGRESIKFAPPLTIAEDALLEGLDTLESVLEDSLG